MSVSQSLTMDLCQGVRGKKTGDLGGQEGRRAEVLPGHVMPSPTAVSNIGMSHDREGGLASRGLGNLDDFMIG